MPTGRIQGSVNDEQLCRVLAGMSRLQRLQFLLRYAHAHAATAETIHDSRGYDKIVRKPRQKPRCEQ